MLSIRLQRVGRKGHALYRIIVQDSHRQPTSGKVVAQLGSYDPHAKTITVDKEKAELFLKNGAQPTPRVVSLFKSEKVKLPKWVEALDNKKKKTIKNPEKLRRNQPAAPAEPETPEADKPAEDVAEVSAENSAEAVVEAEAPIVEEAEKSVEQIAEAEVADGQETAEEEVAEAVEENADETIEKT